MVSNVFGFILPIREIAALCREKRVPLIVDASQAAGILDVDFTALGAAFIAMPGHKGLLGPQGTGLLLCGERGEPLLSGGSGSDSLLQAMPEYLPDRLEAGTHNVCGIAGLLAGVRYVQAHGCAGIRRREQQLMRRFTEQLSGTAHLRMFLSRDPELQTAVLSLIPEAIGPDAFAEALNANGLAVRTGLHCAPTAHRTAGTISTGTVRFSFSPFNTEQQIDYAAEICKKILKNAVFF